MKPHKIAIVAFVVIAVIVVLQVKATRSPVDEEQSVAWTESDGVGPVEPQLPADDQEPQLPGEQDAASVEPVTPPEPAEVSKPEPEPKPKPEPPRQQDAASVQPATKPEPAKVSKPAPKPNPKPKPESKPQPTEKAQQSGEAGSADAEQDKPAAPAPSASEPKPPAALPRMVDVGSEHCIPCKMMAPILDELQREYAGKVSVEFVNLAQDPKGGRRYGVRIIPTQIFIDSSGQEVFRHVGFYSKEDILAKFKELGFTK